MRSANPLTRFYEVKPGKSGWARIWITDDGCISIMSDWGNFGYWFGAPGCEFRKFLTGCDDDYLGNKFAAGKEFDGEETADAVRERIRDLRLRSGLSATTAREEWDAVPTAFDDDVAFRDWMHRTLLSEAWECAHYVRPHNVTQFIKHVWPLFMEMLKAELTQEAIPKEAASA